MYIFTESRIIYKWVRAFCAYYTPRWTHTKAIGASTASPSFPEQKAMVAAILGPALRAVRTSNTLNAIIYR